MEKNITPINQLSWKDRLKSYKKHPGSFILLLLVGASAVITVTVLVYLVGYILIHGVPYLRPSLFSLTYNSDNVSMMPAIINTITMVLLALLFSVPFGIGAAIYLVEYAKKGNKLVKVIRTTAETLTGIPSIVYGFFGLVVIVPLMAQLTGKNGNTMLTASILLAVMILPTVVGVTESAITSVPESYYEASLGLGATHSQSVFFAVVPAAKSGILAGIVLGIGRAIGETMAVIMIAGNQPRMPKGITEGLRTMTANIVLEMGYASGLHREALIATGVVLFVFILLINLSVSMLNRRVHYGD